MAKAKPKAAASKAKGAGGVPGGAILAAVLVVAVAAAMGLLFPWGVAAPEAPPEQLVRGVARVTARALRRNSGIASAVVLSTPTPPWSPGIVRSLGLAVLAGIIDGG